ncbi:MAG TPA: hypothetical protein VFN78_00270 [Ktedonobacterales bacterium]|nr:hypothetical protein [Ktedonobacterales bacterium]
MGDMWQGLRARRLGVVAMFTVAMMLALAGCESPGPLPGVVSKTASPHTTITPKAALDWRHATLPTPFVIGTAGIAISPANGSVAWFCAPATGTQGYQVWRTNDLGATWVKAGYLTLAPAHAIMGCSLAANQSDPNAVAVNFNWGNANAPVNAPQGTQSNYSIDGGATWTTLPQDIWVDQVVSAGATTYAEIADTSQRSQTSLITSTDHLASWNTVSAPGQDNTHPDFQFWAASTPGELLWANMNAGGAVYTDYAGSGGVWNAITPPTKSESLQVTLAVWQSAQATGFQANGWLICGYIQEAGVQNGAVNVCTHDRGTTWTTFPPLKNTWECAHCGQGGGANSGDNPCLASAISASGALYAVCGNDPQDSGEASTPWAVSRVAPGSSTWTTLGQAPCQQITTTSTGQAWCLAAEKGVTTVYVIDMLP